MATLRAQLDSLASSFAESIVDAIRGASLQELLGAQGSAAKAPRGRRAGGGGQPDPILVPVTPKAKTGRGGRLARRSSEDIAAALGDVVALLKKSKDGLRAEEIRAALKMESKEMPRVLREGLSTKMLSKRGQKRATVYFAK
jgi:hypothetical protein